MTLGRSILATLTVLLVLASAAVVNSSRADNQPDTPAAKAAAPSSVEIQQWIKDLDSNEYATRQAAAQMLFEAGKPAIGPLTEAAGGKSLEVTTQSVGVLKRLLQSSDTETHSAAKDALDRLVSSKGPAATQAAEALKPPAQPQGGFGPGIGGNVRIFAGGKLQVANGGGLQVIQLQANNANGKSTTDVQENGKKIHIEQDQNGIEMKVTETVNGAEKTDTYKAKDADDLKKQSAEAFKLYQQYGQNNGAGAVQIQIAAPGIQIGPNGVPQAIPLVPLNPAVPAVPLPQAAPRAMTPETALQNAKVGVDSLKRRLDRSIEYLRTSGQNDDATKDAIKKLEDTKKQLDEAAGKLQAGG